MNHEGADDHEGHELRTSRQYQMRLASYQRAMCLELEAAGLSYESERPVHVRYRNVEITGRRVDLIVEKQIVVELKSVTRLDDVHRAQLISYLRTTGLRGGLLINFRVPVLQRGLQRIVL